MVSEYKHTTSPLKSTSGMSKVVGTAVLVFAMLLLAPLSSFASSTTSTATTSQFQTTYVPTGIFPSYATYDPFHDYLYVSQGSGVSVIKGTTNIANITLAGSPGPIFYDPSNHYVYATGVNSRYVDVINGTTIIGKLPTILPTSFLYDPSNNLVYLATQPTGGVSHGPPAIEVINGTRVIGYVEANCAGGCTMLYDPSNGYVYIANGGGNTTSVVDGTSVKYTLEVGPNPYAMLYNPYNKMVYVANSEGGLGDTVSVINGTDVATIEVGASPSSFIYNPSSGYVYVLNSLGGSLSVISGTRNIANLSIGFDPGLYDGTSNSSVYDPSNGYIYVPDPSGYAVAVINGTRVIANITTGPHPSSILYNPANNLVYVANFGFPVPQASYNVSIIRGTALIENLKVNATGPLFYDSGHGSVYVLGDHGVTLISGPGVTTNPLSPAGSFVEMLVVVLVVLAVLGAALLWRRRRAPGKKTPRHPSRRLREQEDDERR
jgi:YVTN family beta-propeller protein